MHEVTSSDALSVSRRNASEMIAREYLSFFLDGEVYGVDLSRIQSIMVVPELTEVPRAPRQVVGVCSVRGVLVTVVDLRSLMSVAGRELTRQARILLTTSLDGEALGLLVDGVRHVVRPKPDEIELTGPVFGNELTEHVVGIARIRPEEQQSGKRGAAAERAPLAVQPDNRRVVEDVIVLLSMDTICGQSSARHT